MLSICVLFEFTIVVSTHHHTETIISARSKHGALCVTYPYKMFYAFFTVFRLCVTFIGYMFGKFRVIDCCFYSLYYFLIFSSGVWFLISYNLCGFCLNYYIIYFLLFNRFNDTRSIYSVVGSNQDVASPVVWYTTVCSAQLISATRCFSNSLL